MEDKEFQEIAEFYETASGEVEGLVRVKAERVSRPPRHVFSLRLGANELDKISDAAEANGVSAGDFIRQAALLAAEAGMLSKPRDGVGDNLPEIRRLYEIEAANHAMLQELVERSRAPKVMG